MTFWSKLLLFLVAGYLTLTRSFAHFGVPAVNLFIGETAIAAFLLAQPHNVLQRWITSLQQPTKLSEFSLAFACFLAYGWFELVRGLGKGNAPVLTLQGFAFHYYPICFFIGLWLGSEDPRLLGRVVRVLAWTNGIYGLLYIAILNRIPMAVPGTSDVPLFGQPAGSAIVILGLLCLEPVWSRVWHLLLINLLAMLGLQVRAEFLGFILGVVVWSMLTRRFDRLLAGFAVVAALLVLVLANFGQTPETRKAVAAKRGHLWSGWPAFRSLGVLMATAFAAGGWWELMMLYSSGGQFLSGWFWGLRAAPPGTGIGGTAAVQAHFSVFSTAYALRLVQELFAMSRVLSGLTILGLWTIGRGLLSPACGARRPAYLFLAAWFACALFCFAASLRLNETTDAALGSLYLNMWRLFLMSACTACSALALDEVARRRISLPIFVSVTFGALLVGYAYLHPKHTGDYPSLLTVAAGLVFALAAAQILRRLCELSERRQWLLLSGLIIAYVAADASIGISNIRADDQSRLDWRALSTFHNSLPPHNDTGSCLLISESKPPYRLILALKSAWPTAEITVVPNWDEALKLALDENQMPKTAIVVDWSEGNSRPANPTGAQWKTITVGNPQYFDQRQLRAYVLESESDHKTPEEE